MKRKKRLIALAIAMLILIVTVVGCVETVELHIPEYVEYSESDDIYIDLALEMVPLSASPAVFTIPIPSATGRLTHANSKAIIDYSNTADGYVMVRFANSTNMELRVLITGPSSVQYQYTLKKNGTFEVYPLSDGNGRYTIGVFEQVDGNRFATAITATIDVRLNDEFAPFLRPNQYVNFTRDSRTVAKAAELTRNSRNLTEQISAIYNFVISNITYDRELAANVKSGYLPDVDSVLARGKGICFDYAALMTAMLRSQGVPTRLVVGYAGTVYHAWIDVYSREQGWINNVIFFDGRQWKLMDPTFASSGSQSASVMQYIGDGKNYSAKFLY